VRAPPWLHFPGQRLCESAKCRQFTRFQIFVPTSQALDVGSIPIARSLLMQLAALSRESYEPEEGVNRGQRNVPVATIYDTKQVGSTARDVHAP
jgi:hypothetical protein